MTDDKTRVEFNEAWEHFWWNAPAFPDGATDKDRAFYWWQAAKERYGQAPVIARSLSEWHEDDGQVLWWAWCGNDWAGETAWLGTPLDDDWRGYHTHWTPHPEQPATKEQKHEQ